MSQTWGKVEISRPCSIQARTERTTQKRATPRCDQVRPQNDHHTQRGGPPTQEKTVYLGCRRATPRFLPSEAQNIAAAIGSAAWSIDSGPGPSPFVRMGRGVWHFARSCDLCDNKGHDGHIRRRPCHDVEFCRPARGRRRNANARRIFRRVRTSRCEQRLEAWGTRRFLSG